MSFSLIVETVWGELIAPIHRQKILSELSNMYKAGIVTRLAGQAYSLEATAVAAGVRLPSDRNYNYLEVK